MNRDTLIVVGAAVAVAAVVAGSGAWLSAPPPAPEPAQTRQQAPGATDGIARLQRQVAEDPTRVGSWRALGRRFMAAGRYLEAVEAWSVVAELRPGDPEAAAAFAQLDEIAASRGRHRDQGR